MKSSSSFLVLCAGLFAGTLFFVQTAWADKLMLVAGGEKEGEGLPARESKLREPFGCDFDAAGNLWVIEMVSGNRLIKIDSKGLLTHVAGQLKAGLSVDPAPGAEAQFNGPHSLAVRPDGNVLIGDTWNKKIRQFEVASGKVTAVPGLDAPTMVGSSPFCIALDFSGTRLYVADLRRVWVIELATGKASVCAGNGQKRGVPADGALAAEAPLVDPRAVAPDRLGNVYILERDGHALRVVDKEGRIRTVVNASGKAGATGDGGPALEATMNGPKHLCVDRDNSVIIADAENHLVRRYQPADGKIYRVAGTGKKGKGEVGHDPLQTDLARPHGVTVNAKTGELYITDSYNDRVLKITKGE